MEINHLSYSSISTYQLCPRSWRFKYVDHAPTMTAPALVFGSAWHKAVEDLIAGKTQDPVAAWKEAFGAQAQREDVCWGSDTPEEHLMEGARMIASPTVSNTIRSIVPLVDDRGPFIERYVQINVPGVELPIIGYIDVLTQELVPCDIKTANRAWTPDKLAQETQSLYYLAGLNQQGYQISGLFRHYIFVKGAKEPKVQVLEETHKAGELFWLFDHIQHVWAGISGGVFPMEPTSWKCSPNWCEYWTLCRGKHL